MFLCFLPPINRYVFQLPLQIVSFQCVLMTNGTISFAKFLYADGEIQWTTGDASGGSNGFGGTPAQVGFDAGDGERFSSVPGSQTDAIVNISTTSNVGIPGVWTFQVNGNVAQCDDMPNGELLSQKLFLDLSHFSQKQK